MGSLRDHARPIERRQTRRRGHLLWPLLVMALLGLNVYLFAFRGLPTAAPKGAASWSKVRVGSMMGASGW